ncbi:MAG: hypothetical protein ACI8VW_002446, partial [bacterium]
NGQFCLFRLNRVALVAVLVPTCFVLHRVFFMLLAVNPPV